ncbi:MAG: ABC transporter ATP-binding protein/permease [Oscillospiraceae bacterium]|jgi:ATP-binding cassette subfamily B protein|nr:ABC transporter ATP-binding protein/permease [Oscillospiraceae bacterium]
MAQRNKYDIDERLESPFSLRHLKRSFFYIKRHRKKMSAAFLASAASSALSLTIPMMVARALDVSVPNRDIRELVLLAALSAVAIAVSICLNRLRAKLMTEVGQDIIYEIRGELFAHMQALPFSYYDNRPHGKILVRVVQYVNSVSNMLSNGIIDFILEIMNIAFIIVFMLLMSVRLSLVVLAGLPVLFLVFFSIKPAQRRAWQDVSNKNSNLNAYAAESINGMRITQIFTREKKNEEIFERLAMSARCAHFRAGLIANLGGPAVENISQLIFGFLYLAGILWIYPAVSFGVIFAMGSYSWRFWQPINRLAAIYNDFMNTIAYLERIFETMDEPVLISDAPDAYELPKIKGDVEFENVTFGYDEHTKVLDGLSFKVEAGMSVALVGPTGAGKTTIVNLLSRFYDAQCGRILIDGHDISKVTLASLRGQMGIMLQDSFIFSGAVEENIRYGRLDAGQEEIEAAARVVHADEFIEKMEERYGTEIKENGGRLSQGQKQLLAFARTVISDPGILILDEATSSIDTKTEKYVQEGISHLLGGAAGGAGRTSFIIAHRLSTIRECDLIMYIKDGGITERGTHGELMAKRGDYYNMYTSQLLDL